MEISWSKTATTAQLQIIDMTGKIIQEMDLNLNNGTTQLEFSQENLQMGMYLIRLNTEKIEALNPIRLIITK